MEKEDLVEMVLNLKAEVGGLTTAVNNMHKEMAEMAEKLNSRLPLWATAYIAFLTSAVVGMLVKNFGG